MFENLSDGQKQMLFIGVPAVAGFALISTLKKGSGGASSGVPQTIDTSAVGVGQLSEFESGITGELGQLQNQTSGITDTLANLVSVVKNQPVPAAPAPVASAQPAVPIIDHDAYPIVGQPGASFLVIGTARGGGVYNGQAVAGGAPVYANIGGQWVQDFNWKGLAPGTAIATPSQFGNLVSKDTGTAQF